MSIECYKADCEFHNKYEPFCEEKECMLKEASNPLDKVKKVINEHNNTKYVHEFYEKHSKAIKPLMKDIKILTEGVLYLEQTLITNWRTHGIRTFADMERMAAGKDFRRAE